MRENNKIITGTLLILIAAVMMASGMGMLPDISWIKLFGGLIFGAGAIKALLKLDFFGTLFPASIVAWIFAEELQIEHLVPFPLVAVAILLGIGLNMIFGRKHKVITYEYTDKNEKWQEGTIDDVRKEEWQDGRTVVLENNFNSTSKYVNSEAFSSATLENNFGAANVYFDNAVIAGQEATIDLENNFGRMNIYLPGKWRASISQSSSFGHVRVHGEPNRDMDAPRVIIKAESNFGDLNIFFG